MYLGVELTDALAEKAKSVTLVGPGEAPLQSALGKDIGDVVKKVGCCRISQLMTGMRVVPIAKLLWRIE